MALLKQYRQMGLATRDGEFSIPNLAYKSLRNSDEIRALQAQIDLAHDRSLSI
jgi:hypothetical protein